MKNKKFLIFYIFIFANNVLAESIDPQQEIAPDPGANLTQYTAALQNIYKQFSDKVAPALRNKYEANPFRYQGATVTKGSQLSRTEKQFLLERENERARNGFGQFINQKLPQGKFIRTAFCGTGGGYRAMILTSGYLAGLEKTGLLDAISYISSLSGSTWFLAPWTMSTRNLTDYKNEIIKKIATGNFKISKEMVTKPDFHVRQIFDATIWPKFLFEQPIGWVDFYGALLAQALFDGDSIERQKMRLSGQLNWISNGVKPFPVYTAVSMHKSVDAEASYNWYEFNPVEIRNINLELSIPSYAFGSKFINGKAQEIAPEQSLGFLLAIFGSAFAINFKDVTSLMAYRTEKELLQLNLSERVKYEFMRQLFKELDKRLSDFLLTSRTIAAQVNNPFANMNSIEIPWLSGRQDLTFIDGGIAYNIPLLPLLRPERAIDLIIIGESSGDAGNLRELEKAFEDARRQYGYRYIRVDNGKNRSLQLYKDFSNTKAPRIVYISFLRDTSLFESAKNNITLANFIKENDLNNFDVEECISGKKSSATGSSPQKAPGFCNTFNFDYTASNFKQLSGMGEFNVLANQAEIAHFIKKEFLGDTATESIDDDFGF